MVTLLLTDYVANSILYHANEHDLLRAKFGDDQVAEDRQFSEVVQLIIDIFLGLVMPDFEDQYPNHVASIEFSQRRAPTILCEKTGNVSGEAIATVKLFARRNQPGTKPELIMHLDLDTIGQCKVDIIKQVFRGNFSFEYFNFKIIFSSIQNFNEEKLRDLNKFVKNIVTNLIQTVLNTGLKLPELKSVGFRNTKLKVYDRTLKLETDLKLNQEAIVNQTEKALRENGMLNSCC